MKKLIKKILIWTLNLFIPKYKNRIYARPRLSYPKSCNDILNNGSSNMLRFLNAYMQQKHKKKVIVYLEYSDCSRLALYNKYVEHVENNNVGLVFLKSRGIEKNRIKNILNRIQNLIKRLSSKVWFCETGDTYGVGNFSCQKIICLNYFIPCKNDLLIGENFRWTYLDKVLTTALLPAQIMSATMGVKLDNCCFDGFPRNDSILQNAKREKILHWIEDKAGYRPEHIFLYAPTYRDYERVKLKEAGECKKIFEENMIIEERKKRFLLGYEAEELPELLKQTKTVFIYNLHPLQPVDILHKNGSMIPYEENYEFSLYELMSVVDCMITDYSSIGYDYLLKDKPLIYNLYDLEKYIALRGVSYEPYEMFCPGAIVRNWEEMKEALLKVIEGKDEYAEKRRTVRKLLHKHEDANSTQRIIVAFNKWTKGAFE